MTKIDREKIAHIQGMRRWDAFPGWVLDGKAACYVGAAECLQYEPARFTPESESYFRELIDAASDKLGVQVTEDKEFREEFVASDIIVCGACRGEGRVPIACACPKCDGYHVCDKCRGSGYSRDEEEVLGRIVFSGDGAVADDSDIVASGKYAGLLDGFSVRWWREQNVFLACDGAGDPVSLVMLYKDWVR